MKSSFLNLQNIKGYLIKLVVVIAVFFNLNSQYASSMTVNTRVVLSSPMNADSFYVGTPVRIDIFLEGPPWPVIYALVDWNEFSTSNDPIYTVSTMITPSSSFSHVYSSDGRKKVSVLISDNPINVTTLGPGIPPSYVSIDSDSQPSKPRLFNFKVYPRSPHCFEYQVNVTYSLEETTLKPQANVAFRLSDPTGAIDASRLSNLFHSFGHRPTITLRNDTFYDSLMPIFDESTLQWEIIIPYFRLKSRNDVLIDIIPDTVSIYQCTPRPRTYSVRPISYDNMDWGLTPLDRPSINISTTAKRLRWIVDLCLRNHIILYPSPPTADLQFLHTTDAFETYQTYSFLQYCQSFLASITNCSSFVVHDIQFFTQGILLLHTSAGLLQTTPMFWGATKLATGYSIIDSGTSSNFTPRSCLSNKFGLQNSGVLVHATWSDAEGKFENWTSLTPPSPSTIVNAFYSPYSQNWMMLIKNQTLSGYSYATINEKGEIIYTFPDNVNITGLKFSYHEIFVYAFGSHVFRTIQQSDGKFWDTLYQIPMNTRNLSTSPYGTSVDYLSTSQVDEQFFFTTNTETLFYSKSATTNFAILPMAYHWLLYSDSFPVFHNIFFSCDGRLHVGTMVPDSSYTHMKYVRSTLPALSLMYGRDLFDFRPRDIYYGYLPVSVDVVHFHALDASGDYILWSFGLKDKGLNLHNDVGSGELHALDFGEDGRECIVQVNEAWSTYLFGVDSLYLNFDPDTFEISITFSNASIINTGVFRMTLVLNNIHSAFIHTIVNATTLNGRVFSSFFIPSYMPNATYSFYDFRSIDFLPLLINDTVNLTQASNLFPGSNITLNTSFSLTPSLHTNMFVEFNTSLGRSLLRIISINSNQVVTAQIITAQSDLVISSPINSLNTLIYSASYISENYLKPFRNWHWEPDTCRVSSVKLSSNATTFYLSSNDLLQLNMSVVWKLFDPFIAAPPPGIFNLLFTGSSSFDMNISYESINDAYNPVSDIQISLQNYGSNAALSSSICLRPFPFSLSCTVDLPVLKIINECHPSFTVLFNYDNKGSYGLIEASEKSNISIVHLPPNYRPPSSLGDSVPISSNIYNAYPELPRYNDFLTVSKNSGVYKRCLGKAYRSQCGCVEDILDSESIEDSDCVERVLSVGSQETWTPHFSSTVDMQNFSPINFPFNISELNNRTDWCVSDGTTDCTNLVRSGKGYLDPSKNHAIQWKGQELFHFRFYFQFGTYCSVSADLPVYVTNFPHSTPVQQSFMAMTAVAFCLFFLTIYVWFSLKLG